MGQQEARCDVCGDPATVVIRGGHGGSREFHYCNKHEPKEVDSYAGRV
jgi:hypothetical protein